MDAFLQLNRTTTADESRFNKNRETLKRAETANSSFTDELGKAVDAKDDIVKASKDKAKKKLMDACVEAESLFVSRMLKEMRSTIHRGEILNGGQTEEIFSDMLYDQYSLSMSKTANFGLAKQMYDQLSKGL